MAITSNEQIFIHRDGQRIELTGADKEAYLVQKELDKQQGDAIESARLEREAKLESALNKLKSLGLTESEAKIIIGLE